MTRQQLEGWLNSKGFRAVTKVNTQMGSILIAEGEHTEPEPHIRTLWLLDRDGPLWGRWVNHREIDEINGVIRRVTRKDRVDAAVEDALFHLMTDTETASIN